MYKFVIVAVIALAALQGAVAKPKAKPEEKSQIDELAVNARQIVQNVSSAIQGNLPDSKQVTQTLTETSENLANKVKDVVDTLNKKIQENKGSVEETVTKIKDSLTETANKLKEAVGPTAVKEAKDLKAKLDEGLNKAIADAEQLAKAAEPKLADAKNDLNEIAKTLLDKVVELSKNLKTELEQSTPKV